MKHLLLRTAALFCVSLGSQSLQALNANIIKQKLFYAYNLVDGFVTKQEQLNPATDIASEDFARMHHKLIRKILHWIMGGKHYTASGSSEYAKINDTIYLIYAILQESHPYDEDEFFATYGFPLHALTQLYAEGDVINIGTFASGTLLWHKQEELLALCNEYLESRGE